MATHPELQMIFERYPLTEAFRTDWGVLHRRMPGATPFSTLEWMVPGWRHFRPGKDSIRPLRFVDSRGETVAMALHRETETEQGWGGLRTWSALDYKAHRITPLVAKDTDHMVAALSTLASSMSDRMHAFDFVKLDDLGGALHGIVHRLRANGLDAQLEPFDSQPIVHLTDGFDRSMVRGKHTQRNWDRLARKLGREVGTVRFLRFRDAGDFAGADFEGILFDVFGVFSKTWQSEHLSRPGSCGVLPWAAFHHDVAWEMLDRGGLDMCLLYAGKHLAAFDMNLHQGGRVSMVFGGYDQALRRFSPGQLLFMHSIRDSIARGDASVELGTDAPESKRRWANDSVVSHHLRIRGRGSLGLCA